MTTFTDIAALFSATLEENATLKQENATLKNHVVFADLCNANSRIAGLKAANEKLQEQLELSMKKENVGLCVRLQTENAKLQEQLKEASETQEKLRTRYKNDLDEAGTVIKSLEKAKSRLQEQIKEAQLDYMPIRRLKKEIDYLQGLHLQKTATIARLETENVKLQELVKDLKDMKIAGLLSDNETLKKCLDDAERDQDNAEEAFKKEIDDLKTENKSLKSANQTLQEQVDASRKRLTETLADLRLVRESVRSPMAHSKFSDTEIIKNEESDDENVASEKDPRLKPKCVCGMYHAWNRDTFDKKELDLVDSKSAPIGTLLKNFYDRRFLIQGTDKDGNIWGYLDSEDRVSYFSKMKTLDDFENDGWKVAVKGADVKAQDVKVADVKPSKVSTTDTKIDAKDLRLVTKCNCGRYHAKDRGGEEFILEDIDVGTLLEPNSSERMYGVHTFLIQGFHVKTNRLYGYLNDETTVSYFSYRPTLKAFLDDGWKIVSK